jgi:hypothetical protein
VRPLFLAAFFADFLAAFFADFFAIAIFLGSVWAASVELVSSLLFHRQALEY